MAGILQQKTLQTVSNAELANVLDTYNSFAVSPVPRLKDSIYDLALARGLELNFLHGGLNRGCISRHWKSF